MEQVLVECAISFVDQVVLSPAANVDQQTDKLTKSQKSNRRRKLRIKRQKDQELLEKKQGKIVTDSTTSKKRKRNQRANKTCVGDGLNAKLEVAGDVLSAKEEGSSATQVPEAVSGEMVLGKTALPDVKMVSKEDEHTEAVNGKIETANLNVKGAVDSTLTIGEILIPQSLQNLKADNGETGPGSTAADTTASKKRKRTKKKKKSPLSGDILSTCENLEDKVNAIDGLSTTKVLDTKVTNKAELNDITNHNVDGKKGPEVVTSEIGASNRTSKQKTKKQKVGVNHSENKKKTKPTLGKKLVIFDVNGILADIVYPCPRCYEADYYHGRKAVFKRPCLGDFVAFCFEKFNVGIWSSRTKNNLDPVVHDLLGDLKKKLLFTWDASHCTKSWMFTLENPRKLIAFKELRKIWGKSCRLWVKGTFNESNTLLVDDSPYKALLNPKHTGIFPTSYKYTDTNDDFLGPTGALRAYLEGFAAADDGRTYVEQNPFGQGPIDETNRDWIFYSRVLKVHQNEENLNEKENDKLKVDVNPSENKKITKLTLGKKLVIFDVNGILADIVYPLPTNYEADYYNGDEAVFKRPYLGDFLAFCFEKFNVGIWSSRPKKKLDRVVHDLFGDLEKKLLFTWDASHCIESWRLTLENRCERIFFKELRKIWEKSCRLWVKGTFNESNTLLVDDSPYKALLNPKHTGIFPTSYKYTDMNDNFLGPTGALRAYLEGFAAADDGMTYVEQNPFGQGPIDETTQDWKCCSDVLKGQKQYCNVAEVRNEENLNEKESDIQNVNIKEVNEKERNAKVNKNQENDDATQNEKEEKIEKDIEVGNENEGKKKPSRFLVSPYINKKTATTGQAQPDEVMVTDSLFSMEGNPCDFVFQTKKGGATLRDTMQTLAPQLDGSMGVSSEVPIVDTPHADSAHELADKGKGVMVDEELGSDLVSEQERIEQVRMLAEYADLKKSRALAQKLSAQFTTNLPPERQRELDEQSVNFTDAEWDSYTFQAASNPALAQSILGADFDSDTFAAQMMALGKQKKLAAAAKRKAIAAQKAQAKRERPPTAAQKKTYMKNVDTEGADMVRKAEQAAAKAKRAREVIDKMYALRGAVPITSTSSIHAKDVPDESEKVPSSVSMGIYIPGRRMKRMSKRRHISLRRSVRSAGAHTSRVHKSLKCSSLDLKAADSTFIKEGSADAFLEGSHGVLTAWTLTDGQLNTIFRLDNSSMQFNFLKDILHMVHRQDLITLNGLVTKHYDNHSPQGSGLYLLGDLQVLFDSQSSDGKEYSIWKNSHKWKVETWRFYPIPSVHVVETKCGMTVCMFSDKLYPLSGKLMQRMLRKKLEVPPDLVGNDMLHAEHLIGLIKTQLLQHQASS